MYHRRLCNVSGALKHMDVWRTVIIKTASCKHAVPQQNVSVTFHGAGTTRHTIQMVLAFFPSQTVLCRNQRLH